jgi:hypothetical protein|tara:strand:- start:838 stop:1011 length:174 start_codon:yes stop_codon:yes gene_type:complete
MKDSNIDWRKNMLIFMKIIGEERGDWQAEHWETYGIKKEDAIHILDEYEKVYPEDAE